ncbi:MAG: AAA family ATPase [Deltaproteobacteria bacterium]|nr:AAA family ATPase [Deltaproteobacteria bacterium]
MLTKFEVSNFKSIKHLELDIAPFMVLVGPNGAGKTNIVQALELFGELLRQGSIEPIRDLGYYELIRREQKPARSGLLLGGTFRTTNADILMRHGVTRAGSRSGRPQESDDREILLSVQFSLKVKDGEVQISREKVIIEIESTHLSALFGTDNSVDKVEVEADGDPEALKLASRVLGVFSSISARVFELKSFKKELRERLEMMRSRGRGSWLVVPRILPSRITRQCEVTHLRLDASTLRSDAVTGERPRGFIGPAGQGLALAVEWLKGHDRSPSDSYQLLMKHLTEVYPRIEGVDTVSLAPGRRALQFKERGIKEPLAQSSVSDGVLHAIALLLALEPRIRKAGILAIEEPENAIHPWALRKMIEQAQTPSLKAPLLMTTHSTVVVDAIQNPSSLFIVEQESDAGTTATPALDKESALKSILEDSGKKLGEYWLEGGLGGVPTID